MTSLRTGCGTLLLVLCLGHAQGIITTIAGTNWIFRGDGGPALSAPLGEPWSVTFDSSGNLYGVDLMNHIAFRVAPSGTLTVVAGNGIRGYSGDGGLAVNASLNFPRGIALDAAGNIYIADGSSRIRKVSPNGVISTIVGTGNAGFSGDGGPATAARLKLPNGLAFDAAGVPSNTVTLAVR